MQTECLVETSEDDPQAPIVDIKLRFLQVSTREVGRLIDRPPSDFELTTHSPAALAVSGVEIEQSDPLQTREFQVLDSVTLNGQSIHTWQEAVEQNVLIESVSLSEVRDRGLVREFSFAVDRNVEVHDNEPAGKTTGSGNVAIIRHRQRIDASVEVSAEPIADRLFRLRIIVANNTQLDNGASLARDEAANYAMASTHMILGCRRGRFVSLMDPPGPWQQLAAACKNVGAWPVMAGAEPQRDFMLASPIILYDYPQIAPESPGNLFDGAEIDEILTLRIMSLTDEEKQEMRSLDDRTRAILERTENLPPEQLAKLHGAIRGLRQLRPSAPGVGAK
jgi:hypothetical protein